MLSYSQNLHSCRRSLIGQHFGEEWKDEECKGMCDNCQRREKGKGQSRESLRRATTVYNSHVHAVYINSRTVKTHRRSIWRFAFHLPILILYKRAADNISLHEWENFRRLGLTWYLPARSVCAVISVYGMTEIDLFPSAEGFIPLALATGTSGGFQICRSVPASSDRTQFGYPFQSCSWGLVIKILTMWKDFCLRPQNSPLIHCQPHYHQSLTATWEWPIILTYAEVQSWGFDNHYNYDNRWN